MKKKRVLSLLLAVLLLLPLSGCGEPEEVDTSICTVCGKEAEFEFNGLGYCHIHYTEMMRDRIKHAGWF